MSQLFLLGSPRLTQILRNFRMAYQFSDFFGLTCSHLLYVLGLYFLKLILALVLVQFLLQVLRWALFWLFLLLVSWKYIGLWSTRASWLRKYIFKLLLLVLIVLVIETVFLLIFLFPVLELMANTLHWVSLPVVAALGQSLWSYYLFLLFDSPRSTVLFAGKLIVLVILLFVLQLLLILTLLFFFALLHRLLKQCIEQLYHVENALSVTPNDISAFYLQKVILDDLRLG